MRKQKMVQIVLGAVLIAGMPVLGQTAWADDSSQLKQQVQELQDRVDQLESQLAVKQQAALPATVHVSTLPAAMPLYDQWQDPMAQMIQMQRQMERNMNQAFAGTRTFNPRMDIKQTPKEYVIAMDIPGMDKDKINIENKEGMLIVSGERRSDTEDKNNNQYYRQERSFGSFMQAIPLPQDAQKDKIEARYKNGVLTVTVPRQKKEEKKPDMEKITVN